MVCRKAHFSKAGVRSVVAIRTKTSAEYSGALRSGLPPATIDPPMLA
jgi:hypothetical protein